MGETRLYYGDFVVPKEARLIAKMSAVLWRDAAYAIIILPAIYHPVLAIYTA